jgi:hypothetical protein
VLCTGYCVGSRYTVPNVLLSCSLRVCRFEQRRGPVDRGDKACKRWNRLAHRTCLSSIHVAIELSNASKSPLDRLPSSCPQIYLKSATGPMLDTYLNMCQSCCKLINSFAPDPIDSRQVLEREKTSIEARTSSISQVLHFQRQQLYNEGLANGELRVHQGMSHRIVVSTVVNTVSLACRKAREPLV